MKIFRKLCNKFFIMLASLALIIMASTGIFNLCIVEKVDASMISFDNETSISISNGSFNSFSSSTSYPYEVSSYTNRGNKTPSMKTGAINISDEIYKNNYEKYGLNEYENPKGTGSDNYILMINTEEDSNYSYISNEFTLGANGYYYVTISAMTIGDNCVASVGLLQDNVVFDGCEIKNISTGGTWNNYTFLIATNSYEDIELQFVMQIGSQASSASGCVLFDELHAGQISQEVFEDCLNSFEPSSYISKDYNKIHLYKTYNFDNNIITYTNNYDGDIQSNTSAGNYFASSNSGSGDKNSEILNNIAYLTVNDSYIEYKGEEEVLQANSVYRFSIQVKVESSLISGSAFVKVNEILEEENDYNDFMEDEEEAEITAKVSNLTVSNATSNTLNNGFVEYIIYVRTGALDSSKVQFSFGIGSDEEGATGSAQFKNFTISRVPYSAYESASSGSTIGKIDISDRISLPSSEYANFTFDQMKSESFIGTPYPAEPTSWTKSNSGAGYQLSGVVNLAQFDDMIEKYRAYLNVISAPSGLGSSLNNNVLMIYNGDNSSQSYTSSIKNLSANKYYKITIFVNTSLWSTDASGVSIIAKTGTADNYSTIARVENIKTSGQWQKVEMYIHTPNNSVDVSLELALGYGNKLSSGYAFFDNILVEEADNKDDFSNRFGEYVVAGSSDIDLTDSFLTLTTKDYSTPLLYTGENATEYTVNAGIVDLTNSTLQGVIASDYRESLRNLAGDNRKILVIASASNQDVYYKYTSILPYNFESGKYYKLSFEVFTNGIGQASDREEEKKYDNDVLAQGATIQLTGLENSTFKYVESNNKWTKYEFYIGVDTTCTSNIIFSLGSEYVGCFGKVFFGNLNLVEIEQTEFDSASNSENVLKINTIEADDEEDVEEEGPSNNFDWRYVPTILTFVAIVLAVIVLFVRKNIKFKKRVKGVKVNYDRDDTVMQSKYRRLASAQRDKDVREMTKECEELIALRSEYEEKYKDAINRLRSAKLNNRDGSKKNEISAIEREVKHISKEVSRYGVQVNNYESEIEFMQTEAYLIDLERRMLKRDSSARIKERKESALPEEVRNELIAKREAKKAKLERKAELRAQKLEEKEAKLEKERKNIEEQLKQAVEKDVQLAKEKELKKIKQEQKQIDLEKENIEQQLEQDKLQLEKETNEQLEQLEIEQTQSTEDNTVEDNIVEDNSAEDNSTAENEQKDIEEQIEEAEKDSSDDKASK